jgi:hypothetical protein
MCEDRRFLVGRNFFCRGGTARSLAPGTHVEVHLNEVEIDNDHV